MLILPTESKADFDKLESTWFRSYEPRDPAETHLLHQLVSADRLFQRATRTLADVEAQIFAAAPNPLHWDPSQHRTIACFLRYRNAHASTVAKFRKGFEEYRKNRTAEKHKEARLAIATARLQVYQDKNRPKETWEEHIEKLRRKAIAIGLRPPDPE